MTKKKILFYDWGSCVEHAMRIARDGHIVFYHCPWQKGDPTSNQMMVGSGIPNLIKVDKFWDYVDKADVFVFLDTNMNDLPEYLRRMGKTVFAPGYASILEDDRWFMKKLLKKLKLPVNKSVVIVGISNLKEYLADMKDKFIKVSTIRGNMETYHYVDAKSAEPWFDELSLDLGINKENIDFIVEDPIDGIEIGYDGYTIDGNYPKETLYGYEVKDTSYIGKMEKYSNLHKSLINVNSKLSSMFKKLKTRTLFHTELRITDKQVGYLIDPSVRAGRPPSEVMLELFDNFSDIIIEGAEGKLVTPKYKYKYGAMAYFNIEVDKTWVKVSIPKEIRRWVKLYNFCMIGEDSYIIPDGLHNEVSISVVAVADSPEECFKQIEERIAKVDAYKLKKDFDASSLNEVLKKGEKVGIKL